MYHTFAYSQSINTDTLTDLAPVQDGILTIQNGHILPGMDLRLHWAIAFGTNLQRVFFDTPSFRQIARIFLRPIQPSLIGASNPNVADYRSLALNFRGEEEISVQAIHNAGVAQRITTVIAAGGNPGPIPPGPITVTRLSSTTTATANAWSQLQYSVDTALPAGTYAVLLAEYIAANAQAIRLTFDGQFTRPGFPGISGVSQRLPDWYYRYPFGAVGAFRTFSLPRIEALCNANDNAHEVYLHLVKVA